MVASEERRAHIVWRRRTPAGHTHTHSERCIVYRSRAARWNNRDFIFACELWPWLWRSVSYLFCIRCVVTRGQPRAALLREKDLLTKKKRL